jgi:hypothetical protein
MPVTYWIQHADLSAEERGVIDADAALGALEEVDWASELRHLDSLETEQRECCPPGIGFVADDGRILHICPSGSDTALCHYHFRNPGGFLSRLFGTRQATVTAKHVPLSAASGLISSFFAARHDDIVAQLTEAAG